MKTYHPKTLTGQTVQLEPINETHKAELYKAAQDERIWEYHVSNGMGEQFYVWFDKALKYFVNREHISFVVRRIVDQRILGSTRFYDIQMDHKRLAIGNTWFTPEVWGSGVNKESKYLLLQHAFEDLQVNRVEFKVDARNLRSCAAVSKLGAKEEGVLRQHMIVKNGFIRDSKIFSIIRPEWEEIR